jgi:pentatricopeptide repeat protein
MDTLCNHLPRNDVVPQVQKLCEDMEAESIQPDQKTVDCLIQAYQREGRRPDEAYKVFLDFLKAYSNEPGHVRRLLLKPHSTNLNRILTMYQDDPDKGRLVLNQALEFEDRHPECRGFVTCHHFTTLMQKFIDKARVEDAEQLLLQMTSLHDEGRDYLRTDPKSVGIVMDGYARRKSKDGLAKVEALLLTLEKRVVQDGNDVREVQLLDTPNYGVLMKAYLQTLGRDALPKIEETMARMEAMAEKCRRPELRPDTAAYNTFMNAIVRQGAPGYAERVERVLRSIEQSQVSYGVALNAWAKSDSPEAPERMQTLLKSMDTPDTVSYNILLDFYNKKGSYEKAVELLSQMQSDFESRRKPSCRPDAWSYNIVMNALRGAKGVDRWKESSALLKQMLHQFELGYDDCRPNAVTFTQLFHYLADSSEPRVKHTEAEQLWKLARDLKAPFNSHAMHAFVKACRSTQGDASELRQVFVLVEKVFQDAGESALDGRVYVELLEACHRLVPRADRNEGLEMIFKHCARHGYVNEYVLSKLRKVCPELYPRLTNQDPERKPYR